MKGGKPWKKGTAPYSTWLKGLTKEEYEAHLQERRARKSMKKAMETVVLEQQEKWIAHFNNAAAVLLTKAIEEGDAQAFIAVYDRFIGKPKEDDKPETDNEAMAKAIQDLVGKLPD